MAGVFGDRVRGGVLHIFRAAGTGDHPRERNAWHHRAHYTDRIASGNGSAESGVPGFEINDHIAIAARPGERGKDGSVHCAVGQKRNSYVHFKTIPKGEPGFEMHMLFLWLSG